MTKRQTPPGRMSKAEVVVRKPSGPHHFARCFGSVHTDHTRSRGASITREPIIVFGSDLRSISLLTATLLLRLFPVRAILRTGPGQRAQILFEAVEPLLPQAAILL